MEFLKTFEDLNSDASRFGLSQTKEELIEEIQSKDGDRITTVNGEYKLKVSSKFSEYIDVYWTPTFSFPEGTILAIPYNNSDIGVLLEVEDSYPDIDNLDVPLEWNDYDEYSNVVKDFINNSELNYNKILEHRIGKSLYKKLLKGYKIRDLIFTLDKVDYDFERNDVLLISKVGDGFFDKAYIITENFMDFLKETIEHIKNNKNINTADEISDYLYFDSGHQYSLSEIDI